MKKINLIILFVLFKILSAFSQSEEDNTGFKLKKLKFEEATLVSSYYTQNGNHSAVTGGIGTEKLNDSSNSFDLFFSHKDKKNRIHKIGIELGFDTYSSASSNNIDPSTRSSASGNDQRFYPSISWNRSNEMTGNLIGANISFSKEWDYTSFGSSINYGKSFNKKQTDVNVKASVFLDQWELIYPIELRSSSSGQGQFRQRNISKPRNTFDLTLALSHIVNKRFQLALIFEPNLQKGQLSTPYHRVYFKDTTKVFIENLPSMRMKLPLGFRANYFFGDHLVARTFYRFYKDDWGLKANTMELELAIKLSPFLTLTPSYRYYQQSAIDDFAEYKEHSIKEEFYSSDYDLSSFTSQGFGLGIKWKPLDGVWGVKHWDQIEMRYLHYDRSTDLSSDIVSLLFNFK
jgi:hypothetical protein